MTPFRPDPMLAILLGHAAPAVWKTSRIPVDATDYFASAGWRVVAIDLQPDVDKNGLLALLGSAGAFPDYYGHNWDAAADCLVDFGWVEERRVVMLITGAQDWARHHETEAAILRDIVAEAVAFWAKTDRTFVAVWEGDEADLPSLDLI